MSLSRAVAADLPELSRIVAMSFGSKAAESRAWLEAAGIEHLRVVRAEGHGEGGSIAATMLRVPMGTYFGGRSVPTVGVAGVAVPPEHRGSGVATRMMRGVLREVHDEGVALSSLYASTQPLYRGVGYEQAWHRHEWRLPMQRIAMDPEGPAVRQVDLTDEGVRETLRRVYTEFARTQSGMLDRGAYVWGRVLTPREVTVSGLVIGDDAGAPEGYLIFWQERDAKTNRCDVVIFDAVALTSRAWARGLGVLGRFRTVGGDVRFFAGTWHPWLRLEGSQIARAGVVEAGLLRIVRVVEALEGRGYPRGVNTAVEFEVTDDVLPENAGRWSLRVEGGRGRVTRGGSGAVRVSIRALASLYSGFVTGEQAAQTGWAEGSAEALAMVSAMFAGPSPWCPNMF